MSETDSEVIAHLLEESYSELHDKVRAIIQVCNKLHGAYAFVAIFGDGTICGSGEIKHGRLALIDNNSIVVVINPTDNTYDDILSSARELKSRGATIIGISDKSDEAYDHFIRLPNLVSISYPLIEIIPLQILAYYLALRKNIDPDYPRNPAKSVTVK